MDFDTSLRVSASGLTIQRQRMNVIASNIANIHTTRTSSGQPYRRRDLVLADEPLPESFGTSLLRESLRIPKVVEVSQSDAPFNEVYDPNHPDADGRGYVRFPNVSIMEEIISQTLALSAYEANLTAINTSKSMATKAMDIGR